MHKSIAQQIIDHIVISTIHGIDPGVTFVGTLQERYAFRAALQASVDFHNSLNSIKTLQEAKVLIEKKNELVNYFKSQTNYDWPV